MQRDELTLYGVRMADKPMRYQSSFELKEVVANAAALGEEERARLTAEGCLFDDDCPGSISPLNPWWGELTAVHYLLQTNQAPLMGNAQYRRFWSEEGLRQASSDGLYLCEPCQFGCSLADQFRGGHRFDGVAMTMFAARAGRLPFTTEELAAVWRQNVFQGGPMAVGEFKHYKQLMGVLFDCLWPVWEGFKDEIIALYGYDQRAIAFLSERFLSGIVLFREKFIPRIPLRNIPLGFIGP